MDLNQTITEIHSYKIGGYSLNSIFGEYATAVVVFVAVMILVRVFKYIVLSRVKALAKKTKTDFDDLLIKIIGEYGWNLYLPLAVYLAASSIDSSLVPKIANTIIHYWLMAAVIYFGIKAAKEVIDYAAQKIAEKRRQEDGDTDTSLIFLLRDIAKGLLWVIALLMLLENMGYNTSTLIAGLGIGGIAVAFALQNVLSDIFASFSIYFDKPFKVGDYIVIGNDMGTVKRIGIKSTRIQTLQGQELVVSNKELTESRVNNYGKMKKRRVIFNFGVVYQTPNEKLEKIPAIVADIINNIELATLNRVHFKSFGPSSLDFEVAYFIESGEYTKYMDTQQKINLELKKRLEEEGISFAYPTQTIYLQK